MIEDEQGAARIAVKVVPGSRRDQIVGPLGDRLKIKVSAPPEGGRANKAVCALIAAAAGVPERDVEVIAGQTSPEKVIRVTGRRAADLASLWP
jgi:uncharacterized protein (TIGR00251 family)